MKGEPTSGPTSSHERQRVETGKGHLPRLTPEWYRGRAAILWTPTIAKRATGWLTPDFHWHWQLTLLHTCSRHSLLCAAYVLMPDHFHLLWVGFDDCGSDQRVAMEFLRKTLRPLLAPADWQHQPHDHVLREHERERGAFQATAHYIFENPVRASLVSRWQDYAYIGCCLPGYPDFNPRAPDYWERFWRCHNYLGEKHRS